MEVLEECHSGCRDVAAFRRLERGRPNYDLGAGFLEQKNRSSVSQSVISRSHPALTPPPSLRLRSPSGSSDEPLPVKVKASSTSRPSTRSRGLLNYRVRPRAAPKGTFLGVLITRSAPYDSNFHHTCTHEDMMTLSWQNAHTSCSPSNVLGGCFLPVPLPVAAVPVAASAPSATDSAATPSASASASPVVIGVAAAGVGAGSCRC